MRKAQTSLYLRGVAARSLVALSFFSLTAAGVISGFAPAGYLYTRMYFFMNSIELGNLSVSSTFDSMVCATLRISN